MRMTTKHDTHTICRVVAHEDESSYCNMTGGFERIVWLTNESETVTRNYRGCAYCHAAIVRKPCDCVIIPAS